MVLAPSTFLNIILGLTNCSIAVVDDVGIVVMVVFPVGVFIFAECVLRFVCFFFISLKGAHFETSPRFPSYDQNNHPKCDHTRQQRHTRHSTK